MAELKLSTSWKKGLTEDQIKELRAEILSSPLFRKHTISIINELDADAVKESISKDALDKDNWALRQAYNCGYRQALSELKSLLQF